MFSIAQAALIEISFAGSTDNAGGSIDYAPGGNFSGSFIFDTDLAMTDATSPGAGNFREIGDMPLGHSGLISAEVITPLGTVNFMRSLIAPDDELQLASGQIEQLDIGFEGQVFSTQVLDVGIFPGGPGASAALSGAIGGAAPTAISLSAFSQGMSDTFFTDPFLLLSGQPGLSLEEFFGAAIIVTLIDGEDTELPVGELDFFQISLLGDGDPSEVPIPGALLLMLSGLAGLGIAGRKRAPGAS